MGVFLRKEALPGLKQYKYSSIDKSLLSRYILGPFWRWFVTLFPLWVAPNLVTLIGFGFVFVNFLTMLYFNISLDQINPGWVYASYGIGLFLYQTFDACDGGQARRTGQSGPLGELFDHCVDAVNTTFGVLIFCATCNTGSGWKPVIAQFATLLNFYLSTWEEYHTGTLYLSEFSGPVEGIIMVVFLFFLTAYFGPQFWNETFILDKYTPNDMYFIVCGVGLFFNIISAASNVIKSRQTNKLPVAPSLTGVIPFVLFYVSVFIFAGEVINTRVLIPFMLSVGLTSALSVGRIITAHVTSQKFPITNPLMVYPTVAYAIKYFGVSFWGWDNVSTVNNLVWAGLGLTIGTYAMFVSELIIEITTYLDIWCLTIKHKKKTN